MEKHIIITAAGKGTRMKSEVPKQFLCLNDTPILMHTINLFSCLDCSIVVTLPAEQISYWKRLLKTYHFEVPHQIVAGGATRFESVKKALETLPNSGIIAVHDGVRPCVSDSLVKRLFKHCETYSNAVPCCPLKESLRKKTPQGSVAIKRENYLRVQTPQVFHAHLLQEAYKQPYRTDFTDDASVVEHFGEPIYTIEGEENNIKITSPEDIIVATNIITHLL